MTSTRRNLDQFGLATAPAVRIPKQNRSRATVERILLAAEEEIGEFGLAQASTTSIAKRAGVSVGALYRFFRDKDEIAQGMAHRYLETVGEDFSNLVEGITSRRDFGPAVMGLIEIASAAQLKHPGYYRLTEDVGPEQDASPAHGVRTILIDMFVAKVFVDTTDESLEELRAVVELCIETVRHTLSHASREEVARARTVRELERMMSTYLSARFPSD
jgi:AcrR family transcriptional regulator